VTLNGDPMKLVREHLVSWVIRMTLKALSFDQGWKALLRLYSLEISGTEAKSTDSPHPPLSPAVQTQVAELGEKGPNS
jgi:hypothetical protein